MCFVGCFAIIAVVSIQCYVHCRLPHWLPRSFTVGEAGIIAQASAAFLLHACRLYVTTVSALQRNCCFVVDVDVGERVK